MAYREQPTKSLYRKAGTGRNSDTKQRTRCRVTTLSGDTSLNRSIKTLVMGSGLLLPGKGKQLDFRVKSASQSRHQSPLPRKPGSRSPPVAKREGMRPGTGQRGGVQVPSRVHSANNTPKRVVSSSFLQLRVEPPALFEDLKRKNAAHRRDRSLEIKPSRFREPVNANTSAEVLCHSRHPSSGKPTPPSSISLSTSSPAFENPSTDREKLSRHLRRYYLQKHTLPTTTSEYYHFERLIGKGAFGTVSLATHKLTGLHVAIKSLDKAYIQDDRTRRKVFNEVINMRKISNFHVIRLFEVFESTRHFNMVLEYCGGGDLLHFVKNRGKLPESEAKLIFYQVTEAISACQSRDIVHRDIKLDNILMDTRMTTAKLCDFGVSRMAVRGQRINDQCGTPAYIAPEIIVDCGYDAFYVDLWSMGVMLYAMVVGTVPFRAGTLPELHKLILRGKYTLPDSLSPELQHLIAGLLQLVPHNRLQLEEVLAHPWFSKTIDETQVANSETLRFTGRICAHSTASEPSDQVDQRLISQLERYGLPAEFTWHCLRLNEINHATATYELLAVAGDAGN